MIRLLILRLIISVAISFLVSNLFVKQSWAAKQDPSPDFIDTPEAKDVHDQQTGKGALDYVDIAKPKPLILIHQDEDYFYPYSRALSARFGGVFDSQKISDNGILFLAGVIYLYRHKPNEYYDFGFDVRNDSYGTIHAERRWISGRARTRTYTKVGFGLNLVPNDQLATFLKVKNYQVRTGVGLEKTFINPMSMRYEFELLAGDGIGAILSLGYSWGW